MLNTKFGRDWPSGSGEIFFKIWSLYFYYFEIISPGKMRAPDVNNMNSLHPKDALIMLSLFEIGCSGGEHF